MRILKLKTWQEWDAAAKTRWAGQPGPPHPAQCVCRNCVRLFLTIGTAISLYLLSDCALNWAYGVPISKWVGTFQAGWNGLTITSLMWLKERKEDA